MHDNAKNEQRIVVRFGWRPRETGQSTATTKDSVALAGLHAEYVADGDRPGDVPLAMDRDGRLSTGSAGS